MILSGNSALQEYDKTSDWIFIIKVEVCYLKSSITDTERTQPWWRVAKHRFILGLIVWLHTTQKQPCPSEIE